MTTMSEPESHVRASTRRISPMFVHTTVSFSSCLDGLSLRLWNRSSDIAHLGPGSFSKEFPLGFQRVQRFFKQAILEALSLERLVVSLMTILTMKCV